MHRVRLLFFCKLQRCHVIISILGIIHMNSRDSKVKSLELQMREMTALLAESNARAAAAASLSL